MITIFVEGLILEGVHGVTAKEQNRSQPFQVDISTKVDTDECALTDEIGATADYRLMKQAAETVVTKERHALLETIAIRIADAVFSDAHVRSVEVTVRKLAIWPSGVPGVTVRRVRRS
ncbi:MAG TPA: dihydroneopterin aldolase [Candidatus Paceibacterota bacterium]|nr:dihydroneopterin aldolase [Candidatus Paceibacterota bacterium]